MDSKNPSPAGFSSSFSPFNKVQSWGCYDSDPFSLLGDLILLFLGRVSVPSLREVFCISPKSAVAAVYLMGVWPSRSSSVLSNLSLSSFLFSLVKISLKTFRVGDPPPSNWGLPGRFFISPPLNLFCVGNGYFYWFTYILINGPNLRKSK